MYKIRNSSILCIYLLKANQLPTLSRKKLTPYALKKLRVVMVTNGAQLDMS